MPDIVVTLIKEISTGQKANLKPIIKEERITIIAQVKSANRAEFYAAMQAGIKVAMLLRVYTDEYNKQPLAEIDNKRYKIVRSYKLNELYTELSLEEAI